MRRLSSLFVPIALALGLSVASPVGAQQFSTLEERMSAADFKRAGLDKLSDEELAQLNAWLQQDASARAPAAVDRTGFPAGGLFDGGSGPDRVVSTIPGNFRGWRGAGERITLANGQVWRITDSSSRLSISVENPQVVLERNGLGGWQLRVDGYNTRARVVRER